MMTTWRAYTEHKSPHDHTVTGDLRIAMGFYSPQLDNTRDLLVWLPPSYHRELHRRYPVLYMQDGQNLFDARTSYAGEWHVDETLDRLSREQHIEAIVVGIPNTPRRIDEYSPYENKQLGGGRGNQYLQFLIESIKPVIDLEFRTKPDRKHTGILGSSMGGLISLYAFFYRNDVFGLAGSLSPSLWFNRNAIGDYITNAPVDLHSRLYLDGGAHEMSARFNKFFIEGMRHTRDLVTYKGFRLDENFMYVEDDHGEHNEASWARRLPNALRFLLR